MACERKLLESEATTGFFVLLGTKGKKDKLEWSMKANLIASRYEYRGPRIESLQRVRRTHVVSRNFEHHADDSTISLGYTSILRETLDRAAFLLRHVARARIIEEQKTRKNLNESERTTAYQVMREVFLYKVRENASPQKTGDKQFAQSAGEVKNGPDPGGGLGPTTNLMKELAARWLYRVPPYHNGTIHLQIFMTSGIETQALHSSQHH
ncbi:hypothetical protein TNCV_1481911 [Trichonephila clavipes]|nr:hypothetical protein TNCV_1481911 [Trichonephila clavipes]